MSIAPLNRPVGFGLEKPKNKSISVKCNTGSVQPL